MKYDVPDADKQKPNARWRSRLCLYLILGVAMSPIDASAQENLAKGLLGVSYKSASPTLPYQFELPWDVSKFPSVVTSEFKVTEYYPYNFLLRFMPPHVPMTLDEFHKLEQFTGDGSGGPYDPKTHKWVSWSNTEEYKQAYEGVRTGKYENRNGHPGTIITIHLRIERLETTHSNPIVIDTTFNTEATTDGYRREIGFVKLKPGTYRLTASTLQPTIFPPDVVATFLDVITPYNVNRLTDAQ